MGNTEAEKRAVEAKNAERSTSDRLLADLGLTGEAPWSASNLSPGEEREIVRQQAEADAADRAAAETEKRKRGRCLEDVFLEAVVAQSYDLRGLMLPERVAAWHPMMAEAVAVAVRQMRQAVFSVNSPIEELFLSALLAECSRVVRAIVLAENQIVYRARENDGPECLTIATQFGVGPYRADFHLTMRDYVCYEPVSMWKEYRRVVVELDGHEFHEKTKGQAAHDRKRDRFFVAQGLPVLRFTGSEIVKSPSNCAREVLEFLKPLRGMERRGF
jgi:very-short-patch-repair endonuclease